MPEEIIKKQLEKKIDYSISWQSPEYHYYEKSSDWFWTLGIITIGLAMASIILKNFLLALFVFIAGFTIALYGARRPKIINFSIDHRGIIIGNKEIYPYSNLKSFWVEYDPQEEKELIIESKKFFMPRISILLDNADPQAIRQCLLKYLKEEKTEESLMTIILKIFRF